MAVVGVGPLVVCIVILCSGDGRVRRAAVVLQVEGAICDVLRGALLLTVVTRTQLLCLDLCGPLLLLFSTQVGECVLLLLLLLLLGHPASVRSHRGTTYAVAVGVRPLCSARVAVGWQILVKLIYVKAAHVGDDLTAELADVNCTKVNVELTVGALLHWTTLAL